MKDLDRTNRFQPRLGVIFLSACAAGGALAVGLTFTLLWIVLGIPPNGVKPETGSATLLDLIRVALAIVAGVGGAGALVVAYRRQQHLEIDEAGNRDVQKALRERYATAAEQLGHEQASVRLAGAYSMANLADDWVEYRQQCVDVLCAYLRLPWFLDTVEGPEKQTTQEVSSSARPEGEVRRTVLDIIATHLEATAPISWSDLDFNFRGAELPAVDFTGSIFSGAGIVDFSQAVIVGACSFRSTQFHSAVTFEQASFRSGCDFDFAKFHGEDSNFQRVHVPRGRSSFVGCNFMNDLLVDGASFGGDEVTFTRTKFSGRYTSFSHVFFGATTIEFGEAKFDSVATFKESRWHGANIILNGTVFLSHVDFDNAVFSDRIDFLRTLFHGDYASFEQAEFQAGAHFTECQFKGRANFYQAVFGDSTSFHDCDFESVRFGHAKFSADTQFWLTRLPSRNAFDGADIPSEVLGHVNFADEAGPD